MLLKPQVILVDIGNSSIKTTEVISEQMENARSWNDIDEVQRNYVDIPMVVSSVRSIPEELKQRGNTIIVSHSTPLPIKLNYKTPETLGVDRIAAAVGAYDLFPQKNNLVIDMGTCITIDMVDAEGVFHGGIITPGLKMRMRAMADYTDMLPDISDEWQNIEKGLLGQSTKECLLQGSYHSIIHEINGVSKTLEQNFTSLNMILTGGDAVFFESNLKAHIFAGSKIVQKGLYRIWKHHQ